MITQENISLVIQIATLLGILFGVFTFFRKPQEDLETKDAVFDEKITALKEMVVNLRDNHVHTLQIKLESHISESQDVALRSAERMGSIEAKIDMLLKK